MSQERLNRSFTQRNIIVDPAQEDSKAEIVEAASNFIAPTGVSAADALSIANENDERIFGVILKRHDDNPILYYFKLLYKVPVSRDLGDVPLELGVEDEADRSTDAIIGGPDFDPSVKINDPSNTYPALEISSNPDVPCDGTAIVELFPVHGGDYYVFSYPRNFFWAEITGKELVDCNGVGYWEYSWVEKIRTKDVNDCPQWIDNPLPPTGYRRSRTGTAGGVNPLREANNLSVTVPRFAKVHVSYRIDAGLEDIGSVSCEHLFEALSADADGDGSESGSGSSSQCDEFACINVDIINIFNETNIFNTLNFFDVTINNLTEINIFNEYFLCDAWSDTRNVVANVDCILGKLWVLKNVVEYGINKAGCYYEIITFSKWQQEGCCDCPEDSDSDSTSTSTSGDNCESCCGIDDAPLSWWVVIQDTVGVSDIICANCDNYNGVFLASVYNDPERIPACPWETKHLNLCGGTDRLVVWCDETYLYVSDGNIGPVTDVDYWRILLEDVDWSGGPNVLDLFNEGELSCTFPSTITIYAAEPCEIVKPPPPPPPPPECCDPPPPNTLYFNLALGGDPGSVWACFAQPENENIALIRDGSGYVWVSAEGAVTGCCDDASGITVALFCKNGKWHLRFSNINLLISNLEVDSCDPFTLTGSMPSSLPASNCKAAGTGEGFFSITEDAL